MMRFISPYRPKDLLQAEKTLVALAEDPELLEIFRGRFDKPLPSPSSLASTQLNPTPMTAAQERYKKKSAEIYSNHGADRSRPTNSKHRSEREAKAIVKARWIEQGIWDNKWNDEGSPGGFWKHENRRFDWAVGEIVYGTPIQEELRDVEASRPYHQFIYLVSKERENIRKELRSSPEPSRPQPTTWESWDRPKDVPGSPPQGPAIEPSGPGEAVEPSPLDINTQAYERIKAWWVRKGIWDDRWGILPGMKWKHETPVQELVKEVLGEYPADDVELEPDEDEAKQERPPPPDMSSAVTSPGSQIGLEPPPWEFPSWVEERERELMKGDTSSRLENWGRGLFGKSKFPEGGIFRDSSRPSAANHPSDDGKDTPAQHYGGLFSGGKFLGREDRFSGGGLFGGPTRPLPTDGAVAHGEEAPREPSMPTLCGSWGLFGDRDGHAGGGLFGPMSGSGGDREDGSTRNTNILFGGTGSLFDAEDRVGGGTLFGGSQGLFSSNNAQGASEQASGTPTRPSLGNKNGGLFNGGTFSSIGNRFGGSLFGGFTESSPMDDTTTEAEESSAKSTSNVFDPNDGVDRKDWFPYPVNNAAHYGKRATNGGELSTDDVIHNTNSLSASPRPLTPPTEPSTTISSPKTQTVSDYPPVKISHTAQPDTAPRSSPSCASPSNNPPQPWPPQPFSPTATPSPRRSQSLSAENAKFGPDVGALRNGLQNGTTSPAAGETRARKREAEAASPKGKRPRVC